MAKRRIILTDVNGKKYRSGKFDVKDWTGKPLEELLSRFTELNDFHMDVRGVTHYFTPANIVNIRIKEYKG